MWNFASEVEVIPWREEFAIADRNPEVIEELRYLESLLEKGLITPEEFENRSRLIYKSYASKTLAIALIPERKVSFREKNPPLSLILHELGHIYFQEPDAIWSSVYGGGEALMWLIIDRKVDGDEDSIRTWHSLMRMAYEEPEKALKRLDRASLRVGRRLGIDFTKAQFESLPKRPIYGLMAWSGTVPHPQGGVQSILVNILEGVKWGEAIHTELLKELLKEPRTERVMVRLTPEEKNTWEREAEKRKMTLAEFIRTAVKNFLKS